MKIKIESLNGFVEKVTYDRINFTSASLKIQVSNYDVDLVNMTSGVTPEYPWGAALFTLSEPGVPAYDAAIIIGENNEDAKILNRKMFSRHTDYQYWFLFLDELNYEQRGIDGTQELRSLSTTA